MSEIVIRPYEPRDQEATWHVRAMTYNSGRPVPIEQQVYKTATPFVGEVDGRIVGTFVVMDMTCTRGPEIAWKAGGVAGVAVLPEARRTGVGGAMMRWALRHMRDNGYVIASLYAFRESYYRKFGYEVCGARYKITCPHARLPRLGADLAVRRVPNEDYHELKPCYDAFARARSGMNLRTDMHWGRILNENRTLYAAGDLVEAYVILEHEVAFWAEQPVIEFAWCTKRGYESILSFLAQVGINKAAVTWYEPADSPFLMSHFDQGVEVSMEKPIMYRLLNLPRALETLRGDAKFTIRMEDPELPENAGPWEVCVTPSRAQITRVDAADLELDRRHAAQALLGTPSLADLVRNGVASNSPAVNVLPPAPVYCTEFF